MTGSGSIIYSADVLPSACFLTQQTVQTGWTSGTPTVITFGASSEAVDTDTLHDTSSNTSRIVIGKRLGIWEVSGVYTPAVNTAATYLRASIYLNGTAVDGALAGIYVTSVSGFLGVTSPTVQVVATSASDYVELYGYQIAASGTLGTAISSNIRCSFRATWLRES